MEQPRPASVENQKQRFQGIRRSLAKHLAGSELVVYPLVVFLAGQLIFDWVGAPFSVYALRASRSLAPGLDANEAISDGHVWAATAHLYLIVSVYVLVSMYRWMRLRLQGLARFLRLGIAAFVAALAMANMAITAASNSPTKSIFVFTFQSIVFGGLPGAREILGAVFGLVTAVNVLSAIVPAVFCTFVPLLVLDPEGGWSEKELISRIKDVRLLGSLACVLLIAGVLHMYAWMSWAPELLNREGLEQIVGSVTFYWGSVFTMMLAAFYFPVLLVLQAKAEQVMEAQQVPLVEREPWLQARGLSLKITTQLPQIIGILGPLIAAPAGKMIAGLSVMAPK